MDLSPTGFSLMGWSRHFTNGHCKRLSILPSLLGHVRKLPVTCFYVVVFARYCCFLHHLQLASHDLVPI